MKRNIRLGLACVAVVASLSACGVPSGCLDPQPYLHAEQLPALTSPPGLDVPPPDPSMAIPKVTGGPVGRYEYPPGGRTSAFARCLIAPPPMPQAGV